MWTDYTDWTGGELALGHVSDPRGGGVLLFVLVITAGQEASLTACLAQALCPPPIAVALRADLVSVGIPGSVLCRRKQQAAASGVCMQGMGPVTPPSVFVHGN